MKKPILKLLFSTWLVVVISQSAWSSPWHGVAEGFYFPVGGSVETMEVGIPAIQQGIPVGITKSIQQGIFEIFLERRDWTKLSVSEKQRIARFITFEGVITGVVDPETFTANHVLSNFDRDTIVYTKDDFLIPSEGDLICSQGEPLVVEEFINVEAGIGRFAGLVKGGLIVVQGTIGNCPGIPGFLQNNFQVVSDKGGILFDPIVFTDFSEPIEID